MLIINNEGLLIDPDLHDGKLLEMAVSPERGDLQLRFQLVDGRDIRLTLPKIVLLRIDNFSEGDIFFEGNIVFEVVIREGDNCSPETVRKLYGCRDSEAERDLANQLRHIVDNRWTVAEVRSSYGCELTALCGVPVDKMIVS